MIHGAVVCARGYVDLRNYSKHDYFTIEEAYFETVLFCVVLQCLRISTVSQQEKECWKNNSECNDGKLNRRELYCTLLLEVGCVGPLTCAGNQNRLKFLQPFWNLNTCSLYYTTTSHLVNTHFSLPFYKNCNFCFYVFFLIIIHLDCSHCNIWYNRNVWVKNGSITYACLDST